MTMELSECFNRLKKLLSKNYDDGFSQALFDAIKAARSVLDESTLIDLPTKVPEKRYIAFQASSKMSRAINVDLYDADGYLEALEKLMRGETDGLSVGAINSCVYTSTIIFCAANDLLKKSDQKTPGTFFEYLCAAILKNTLGVVPSKSLAVMNLDRNEKLPTDLIFDMGHEKPKFHVPVKTSTRERIIQVWAHQRVIDGAYGTGRFLGCPIILGENKKDSKTREVVEICLPSQWRLYQMHVAQLWRIAYLDIPSAYERLSKVFPPVPVTTLGDLLADGGELRKIALGH